MSGIAPFFENNKTYKPHIIRTLPPFKEIVHQKLVGIGLGYSTQAFQFAFFTIFRRNCRITITSIEIAKAVQLFYIGSLLL